MKAFFRFFYYTSILLTLILGIITLLGSFAKYISPELSLLVSLAGLILPMLLIINFIVAVYWIARWRYWALIPIIAIACNWKYIACIYKIPQQSSTVLKGDILTLASYNVCSFKYSGSDYIKKTANSIAQYMQSQEVDILCLQECTLTKEQPLDSIKAIFSYWPYVYIPQSPKGKNLLQLAVFSKHPLGDKKLISFSGTSNCSLWCDVEINGKKLRIFNNHLQTTSYNQSKNNLKIRHGLIGLIEDEEAIFKLSAIFDKNFKERVGQVHLIKELIDHSPHPMLVCGDFNSLPSSYSYHEIKGDILKDGFRTCGHGYMYTYRRIKKLLRIDYILHTPDMQGLDYFSPELNYSDHKPVLMRLIIK